MHRQLAALAAALLVLVSTAPAGAQESALTDLFNQDPFYEEAGVLRAKGDVPFFADVNFLRGSADSTRTLLGVALSNSAFQFVKEPNGYRAAYEVELRIEGTRGSFRNKWRETVPVASFDETLIPRETIVFQSEFGLLPGTYDLELRVRDTQGGHSGKVETKVEVPAIALPASGYALSSPVLLRFFGEGATGDGREHVLYPSHYFETVPEEVAFFVEVYGPPEASDPPAKLTASLVPAEGGGTVSTATFDVPGLSAGSARVYGKLPGVGMQAGLYRLGVALQDQAGSTLAESSLKLSLSAVTQWVAEHWEEAVEYIAYEATDDEREALEEAPPGERLAAWSEFWEVRDPVPSTPANEAFEAYFRRIVVANNNFGTKLRSGWKSDRGRVYVAFGAPRDIVRGPVPSGSFPLEIWVYDSPGFQIVFEDRIGFGNYQMANPGTFANELAALERRKHRAIAERRAQLQEEGRREEQEEEEQEETGGEGEGGVAPAAGPS